MKANLSKVLTTNVKSFNRSTDSLDCAQTCSIAGMVIIAFDLVRTVCCRILEGVGIIGSDSFENTMGGYTPTLVMA